MSSTDYNYDEQGQFFPFFILTVTGLVTVPLTWSYLAPSKGLENTASRIKSDFRPEHADLIDGQRKKQKRRERKLKRMLFSLGGWLLMVWMVYLILVTARTVNKIWDPYEVLDISRSATEKQIKSQYRRLSLKYHPDKVKLDPAKNLTADIANEKYVELTKAYKTLTDEEVRQNYLQYGHPDGKQSFSIGIALPKWIISEGHGKYVLMVYGVLLGVILPYLVGKWWYGTQRMTKDKVLVASAGNLFREYEDDQQEGGVVGVLSSGEEYKAILHGNKADHAASKLEQKILGDEEARKELADFSVKDQLKLEQMEDNVRRKALALLWAYLGRLELDDQTLNDEKFEVAPTAHALNEAYISIALAYSNTDPLMAAYRTSQNLIQAIAPGGSPLLQLPHITSSIARTIEGDDAKRHMRVQEYMRLSEVERKERSVGPGLLTESQYQSVLDVASQLPLLRVEKAFFKVTGERFITPSSLVQFIVKARIIPPGSTKVPRVTKKDLEDIDPEEGDLDALHERNEDKSATSKPIQPPLAHAPYFARDHSPKWHVYLADSKQGKIAVPPFTFSTFDKPIYNENGEPTFNVQTLRMQFGAPPHPGRYTFVMHLVCDSYVGMDHKQEITLEVEDASKAEDMDSEDDISEPDEDTIAGQMNALKTGGAPAPRKRRPQKPANDSSDDESGTDDDDDDSETDTDTDTDSDEE